MKEKNKLYSFRINNPYRFENEGNFLCTVEARAHRYLCLPCVPTLQLQIELQNEDGQLLLHWLIMLLVVQHLSLFHNAPQLRGHQRHRVHILWGEPHHCHHRQIQLLFRHRHFRSQHVLANQQIIRIWAHTLHCWECCRLQGGHY